MAVLKWLLLPFSLVYFIITKTRNILYDNGIFKSYSFRTTTICVGNLSVGGTGKSPMIEYLIKLFGKDFKVAVLSRGYGRDTKGFLEVNADMKASHVGDEPLQFKRKFNDILVFVDASRKNGIEQIEKNYPETELILLDDAYQHRKVKADVNILLTTYSKPFYNDFILPVGRLRESVKGKNRADVIIVTKCPYALSLKKIETIKTRIKPSKDQKILFSKIAYSDEIYNNTNSLSLKIFDDFYLITGIANPMPLVKYLEKQHKTFKHLKFTDHHNFTTKEIENLKALKKPILTTEKDFTRLYRDIKENIYYIPINFDINEDLRPILKIKPQ